MLKLQVDFGKKHFLFVSGLWTEVSMQQEFTVKPASESHNRGRFEYADP